MNGETPEQQPELQVQNGSEAPITAPPASPESEAIDQASRDAIAIHLTESVSTGPKKRGPKPKRYPPAGAGAVPGNMAAVDQKPGNNSQPQSNQAPPAPFDETAAKNLVEGGIEVLNEISKTIIGLVAKKHNCTPEETKAAIDGVTISDKARALIKDGGVLCAKKYSMSTGSAPEMLVGMGLALWGGSVFMTYRAITAEDEQTPAKEEKKQ